MFIYNFLLQTWNQFLQLTLCKMQKILNVISEAGWSSGYYRLCVWQVSRGGALPPPERGRNWVAGRRCGVRPQEEGGWLVQRHPAEDRPDGPVSGQLRWELLNWEMWTKDRTLFLFLSYKTYIQATSSMNHTHEGWTDTGFTDFTLLD